MKNNEKKITHTVSRRRFIELGCKAGAGAFLIAATGCSPEQFDTRPNAKFMAVPSDGKTGTAAMEIIQHESVPMVLEAFLSKAVDLSFLSPGDSVFIKVACNSDNDHPAVTNPEAIPLLVSLLKKRGAGDVYVGDQSGVETVRLTRDGRVSSTRALMKKNGLLDAITGSGAKVHCFDDQGWDGYFQDFPDFQSSWENGILLPNIINEVDHIIYLPRLGSHALAGYTCAVKSAVGWLRDDSRLELHQQGDTFFEKFAEINHFPSIRNKLRFALTIADSVLLNIGPDIGSTHTFDGTLLLAADNLVDHDYIASLLLRWFDTQDTSILDIIHLYPNHVNFFNKRFVKQTWGKSAMKAYEPIKPYNLDRNIAHDSCLSHLGWLQGHRPESISVLTQKNGLPFELQKYLAETSEGILSFSINRSG
jgi:uncharacterized protein (DUF362 family)